MTEDDLTRLRAMLAIAQTAQEHAVHDLFGIDLAALAEIRAAKDRRFMRIPTTTSDRVGINSRHGRG